MSSDFAFKALALAGELATTTRMLVGGRDFTTGAERSAVSIDLLPALLPKIRETLDEYDELIRVNAYSKGDKA